jgi:Fe-S cluster assembly protein SufD
LASVLAKPSERDGLISGGAQGHEAVIALNTAFMTDGALVRIAPATVLDKPLMLVFARAGEKASLLTMRNIVRLGGGAAALLIEAHVSLSGAAPGQTNVLSDVSLGDGARLEHVKLTREGEATAHVGTWMVGAGEDSLYRVFQMTAATGLARHNLFVVCKGEGARLDITGAVLGRGAEHVDSTLVIDHAVPGCESRELVKAVLADRARGVFQGKVIVRPDAQKTDGKQMAQALMLSDEAEFNSKPELEIHADDVVCGHGSTSAEIDENLLFYLRSRGIPPAEARALLIESFIGEAIDKAEPEALREALWGVARPRLAGLADAA